MISRSRVTSHRSFFLHSVLLHPRSFSRIRSSPSLLLSYLEDDSNTLKRLNHKDWLAPNEVLKIVKVLRNPNSFARVLEMYSKRKDYKPNEALYALIINRLAQAKMFDAIEDLMARIKAEKACNLSDEFFYNVIKIYGNVAGRIKKAIDTLFEMPEYGCWPKVKTFNLVLNLLVSAKMFDIVHEVYLGASKLGIEIDACCLNIMIKGLCESGNLESALDVLDEFPKLGRKPNARTFSTLMHTFCERGKVEEAFEIYERMLRQGVDPDTVTYNILIGGLRKRGRVQDCMELLERMKLKGCNPNWGSYQELLYGLLDTEKFVEAKDLMNQMISRGIGPSFVSYRMLITGLCREHLIGDVESVLQQMVQQGFLPKMGMWKKVLEVIFAGKSTDIYNSFDELVEN